MGTKTEALLVDEAPITEIDGLKPLIAEGQERGFLTIEQIAASLEEVEITKEQVAELHAYFEGEGIDTGVDLDELIAVAQWLEGVLGRQLEGQVYRAGNWG